MPLISILKTTLNNSSEINDSAGEVGGAAGAGEAGRVGGVGK